MTLSLSSRARRAARDEVRRASRNLGLQRLAQRVIRFRDREAAMVLGDALMEDHVDVDRARRPGFATGRTRLVNFYLTRGVDFAQPARRGQTARVPTFHPAARRIFTHDEIDRLLRMELAADTRFPFAVRGRELLYNVPHYSARPDEERWGKIFTMWITTRQDVYRALVAAGVLPRSIRFHELRSQDALGPDLAYRLFLERTPPRRQRPIRVYLFDVWRDDTPATREVHFDEDPEQLSLLG